MRRFAVHVLALALYALAAIVFTWPLAAHLPTHLLGDTNGDTGVYAWNLWVFAREWNSAGGVFRTDAIFPLTGGADFALHNYTVASNLLALPLIESLGPVATFNVVLLVQMVLAAYGAFALTAHLTRDRRLAWIAGLAFACSPVLIAKSAAHHSLVAAAPLPFFALTVIRALQAVKWAGWAAGAGACLAWATYSDVYYGVYCLVLLGVALASDSLRLTSAGSTKAPRWLLWSALGSAALGGVILVTGGTDLEVRSQILHLRTPYNPMTVAMGCLLLWGAWALVPRLRLADGFCVRRVAGLVVTVGSIAALLLSPLLAVMFQRWLDGRWVSTSTHWRSSAPGLDALALLLPNPTHGLWGEVVRPLLWNWRADAFPEHVGSLSLVSLAVVGAVRIARGRWPSGAGLWVGLTGLSVLLSLGPFLTVAGHTTGIPGPWSLLRFVPVLGWAKSPSRFAVLATLGLCVLLALTLRDLWGRRSGPWMVAGITALLTLELSPMPRTLFAATPPSVYSVIAADPDPRVRVLELPAGVRDGLGSIGNFTARTQFHQTAHGKPIVGGYLSRVSERRKQRTMSIPTMRALVLLSEGRDLTAVEDVQGRFLARQFVQRARIGYVLLARDRVSPALRAWATEALGLRLIAAGDEAELYRPVAWPPEEPVPDRELRPDTPPPPPDRP
jgi:hypothetical protein